MLDEIDVVSTVHNILKSSSSIRQSMKELESAIHAWQQLDLRKNIPSSSKLKSEKEKEKAKDAPKEGMFGIFKKSMYAYSFFLHPFLMPSDPSKITTPETVPQK
jgi:hypothetical protein